MAKTKALFFWLSGIFTPTLPIALQSALREAGFAGVNVLALADFRDLQDALTLGQIDGITFCERLVQGARLVLPAADLQSLLLKAFRPEADIVPIIQHLPEDLQRRLVVDLPVDWFEALAEALGINAVFSPDQRIFLGKSRLVRLQPDIFYHMSQAVQLPMENCLLLDENAKRTMQAINHGFPAAVILDSRRLEREFVLRKLIVRDYRIHQRPV